VLALVFRAGAGLGGDADGDAVRGDILSHDGVRTDSGTLADGDGAENFGAGADGDVVADGGVALGLGKDLAAESDAVVEHHTVADLSGLANDDAHAVVDEETAADGGAGVDFHTGEETGDLRQDARRSLEVADP